MRFSSSSSEKSLRVNLSLPLFITQSNKIITGILMFAIGIALYSPANHLHLFTPHLLPMSWVDLAVPFMPDTVWIYLSEYVFFAFIYLSCKSMTNLNKYFYSFLVLWGFSAMIFWLFPTTYPRSLYPLPGDMNALSYFVFSTLRALDTPANCCPSLHVSSVYLSAFLFLEDDRRKFPLFFTWATAIAISTLTTKQHYLVDIISGFGLAVLSYWFFFHCVTYSRRTSDLKFPMRWKIPQFKR